MLDIMQCLMYENYFPDPTYTPTLNDGLGQAFGYKENPVMQTSAMPCSMTRHKDNTPSKHDLFHRRLSIIKSDPDQFSVVYTPSYEYVPYKRVKFSLPKNTMHRF